ncbi:MAG: hypothetical protein AAF958_02155 [Planctomycetota bacterium]
MNQATDVFPLPLSPLEKFFLWDDRPSCPMTSFFELQFDGILNRSWLDEALNTVCTRHPLLQCTVARRGGDWFWELPPAMGQRWLDVGAMPALVPMKRCVELSPWPMDLTREPGCRFWCQTTDSQTTAGRSRILIQLHHAVCDGIGMRQVLIDLLCAYRNASESAAGREVMPSRRQIRPREITRLLERFDLTQRFAKPAKVTLSGKEKRDAAYYFHFQRPRTIATPRSSTTHLKPSPDLQPATPRLRAQGMFNPMVHVQLDRDISARIIDRCNDKNTSVNELAIALLFRTLVDWNRQHRGDGPKSRLRLLMPVDLRGRQDLRMPATNRLAFAFLGRTHAQCESWPELLESVRDEVKWIGDSRVFLNLLAGFDMMHKRPWWFRRLIAMHHNMMTCVLTYAGDISRGLGKSLPIRDGKLDVGDCSLEHIYAAPPARRGSRLGVALCINWGKICFSANYDRRYLSRDDTQLFLNRYADSWSRWAEDDADFFRVGVTQALASE